MLRPRFDVCGSTRSRRGLRLGAVVVGLVACTREPEPFICPEIEVGDLAITELRGADGTYGDYVELANTTSGPIDIRGIQLILQKSTGGGLNRMIVRTDSLVVEGGDLVVLGHHEPDEVPEFVDYSFFSDFFVVRDDVPEPLEPKQLYDAGLLQVLACGEEIDRVVYPTLPLQGSWAFDGALAPDAETNDDPDSWCTDDVTPGAPEEIGLPGTPGEENPPCVVEADTD